MEKDSGQRLCDLAVDGGMSNSDLCMQVCSKPVHSFNFTVLKHDPFTRLKRTLFRFQLTVRACERRQRLEPLLQLDSPWTSGWSLASFERSTSPIGLFSSHSLAQGRAPRCIEDGNELSRWRGAGSIRTVIKVLDEGRYRVKGPSIVSSSVQLSRRESVEDLRLGPGIPLPGVSLLFPFGEV